MGLFKFMINPGDTVVDVRAHIRYVSLLFKHLVGLHGVVTVFELGESNLPYIRKNVADRGNCAR
jgi:hypothetical protein